MERNNDGARYLSAGRSAPVRETGDDRECLFCRKVIQKSKPLKRGNCSHYGHVCIDCEVTESFTMKDLQKMTRADKAALRRCSVLRQFEVPPDGSDVLIGFFEWQTCGICRKALRKNDSMHEHNVARHSSVQHCDFGCNQYSTAPRFEAHNKSCGIWCPWCEEKVDYDYWEHFANERDRVFVCPADGCCTAFLRDDLEGACAHLLSNHIWRSPFSYLHFIPEDDEETMEN